MSCFLSSGWPWPLAPFSQRVSGKQKTDQTDERGRIRLRHGTPCLPHKPRLQHASFVLLLVFFLIQEHLMFPTPSSTDAARSSQSSSSPSRKNTTIKETPTTWGKPATLSPPPSPPGHHLPVIHIKPKNTKSAHKYKYQPRAGGEPNIYKHGAPVHTKHTHDAHEGRLCASTLPPLRPPLLRLWYLAVEKDQSGDGDGGHKQTSQPKTENSKHHAARPPADLLLQETTVPL